jgi:hypothetical protein
MGIEGIVCKIVDYMNLSEISGSHGSEYEDDSLLGY